LRCHALAVDESAAIELQGGCLRMPIRFFVFA